ncbi:trypsin [Daphnia pulex]|uniref:Trypsin n=1 Tax=Daphnia pulex TaxID=6669 RepID=E9GTT4_DAPPU|nr:trypsin [Daphnia pulex]|eukprot:EFX77150.1 trypsin [Daphnia pulex]
MKFVILAATILACVIANPSTRSVLPRLPLKVLLSGKFQMIPEDKIVGGTEVAPNSLPFQISLQRRGLLPNSAYSHICGGSILDATTILDAAHCVDGANVARLRVVVGEHSQTQASGLEQISAVSSFTMHENYSSSTYENDISLIFVATPFDLSVASARPVNLPAPTSEFDPPAGTIITVSGWGTTSEGGSVSDTLLSVDIPVISDADCNTAYGGNAVFSSMMCAGGPNGGIDSCQGDSGGPLFTGTGETAVQHGIVSWGQGCAQAAYPGVYTQVSYFLDWIAANKI